MLQRLHSVLTISAHLIFSSEKISNKIMSKKHSKNNKHKPHLLANSITKSFGAVQALKHMDFEVNKGEVMGLVGDNGAGKSTLMRILTGVEKPDSGEVSIDGNETKMSSPQDAVNAGISVVYQSLALCENLSASENVFLGKEILYTYGANFYPNILKPLNKYLMEAETKRSLENLKVDSIKYLNQKINGLSGGQRQCLAIARAIHSNSDILLLDEPTSALGFSQTEQVLSLIKKLRTADRAIVIISHNLSHLYEVCDRITVMKAGQNVGVFSLHHTSEEEIIRAITIGEVVIN